ncbi:MAG: HAD family hydrolase [Bacteroidales bacterium]|nr:HAD family hydrolase [Bacteroidales bacterium]
MRPKAAIFDLDGTLYNKRLLPLRLAYSQLLKGKLSYLVAERRARKSLKGRYFGDKEVFEDAFFNSFGKKGAREWYYDEYMPDMARVLKAHYEVDMRIAGILKDFRSNGAKTAVFSDYGFVRQKLEAIGFDIALADYLFEAPALGGLKPCREVFMKVCELMGVSPEECVMYGDRNDTDGAGSALVGMNFVNVSALRS